MFDFPKDHLENKSPSKFSQYFPKTIVQETNHSMAYIKFHLIDRYQVLPESKAPRRSLHVQNIIRMIDSNENCIMHVSTSSYESFSNRSHLISESYRPMEISAFLRNVSIGEKKY